MPTTNLGNIIKLTQEQYDDLLAGNLSGHTYDPNSIYLVDAQQLKYQHNICFWDTSSSNKILVTFSIINERATAYSDPLAVSDALSAAGFDAIVNAGRCQASGYCYISSTRYDIYAIGGYTDENSGDVFLRLYRVAYSSGTQSTYDINLSGPENISDVVVAL